VPKRLRWYLEREPQAVSAVLHILLRVIEGHLRRSSDAGPDARFGAVSFIHRFGASLNRHVHFDENHPGSRAARALSGAQIRSRRIGHCCVIDGVFEPIEEAGDVLQPVRFRPASELTAQGIAAIAEQVRVRVLRWFARSGLIEPDDVHEMRAPRSPPGPTAASRWMPRCAWARTIAPGWSGCCAIVRGRRSHWSVWSCSTPNVSSTGCPSHSVTAPRRWRSRRWS